MTQIDAVSSCPSSFSAAAGARLLADFEQANDKLVTRTASLLGCFVASPGLHARFLNTLSLMEHIGSHKIMATQAGLTIDQPTLKHLAEETRHAFFFKRQAEALARRSLTYQPGELLMPSAARMYFQRLEGRIVAALGATPQADSAVYLTMSMIVEFRAVWAYRLYQSILQEAGSSLSLRSLLAEEARHLDDMGTRLVGIGAWQEERIRDFCRIEGVLYRRLLTALESAAARPLAA